MLAIYFFGSAQVWKMSRVPFYRQEEARVILQARHEALAHKAKEGHAMILAEF
jgi:hypothetical protein